MYDVTDVVFRQIILQTARPDVFFTEFVNAEAFFSGGREDVLRKLRFTKDQRPIVAQIWGSRPDNFYKFAKELVEMGFDGIDINMGCPEKSVIKQGVCAALINNHSLAKEIIEATTEGAGKLPVSIKTRTGIKVHQTEEWFDFLLEFDLCAITLHGRTVEQMSDVPADWNEIKKAVDLRNTNAKETLIIGNGDVPNAIYGSDLCQKNGADGFMIGRGIFSDLYAFATEKAKYGALSKLEKLKLMKTHIGMFDKEYSGKRNYHILKKYYKIYLNGFDGAAKLREEFMSTLSVPQALKLLESCSNLRFRELK